MRFGEVPVREAAGAILAHSIRCGGRTLRKGLLLDEGHAAMLAESGIRSVAAARLEDADVHEDEAARLVADALKGPAVDAAAPFTGRVNLVASEAGVARLDTDVIKAVNMAGEAVTVATLPAFGTVAAGQMVATVKIIPFAVPRDVLDACLAAARASGAIGVAAFRPRPVSLIMTETQTVKPGVLAGTSAAVAARLDALGLALADEVRVPHRADDLAVAIAERARACDLVLVFGASAITDRRDVIPAALEQAGGTVDHLGMPVDPGNLLLLGRLGGTRVLGLPGCARSPAPNGLDLVLRRLAADLDVTGRDIMAMGVGGLLKDTPLRGGPRRGRRSTQERSPRIGAIVLAAGRSRRMGARNKLLIRIDGKPMIRHVVDALVAAGIERPVRVVTGHQADAVRSVLEGCAVTFTHNARFAEGLGTSLGAGIAALPDELDAVLVCLGDMPAVAPADLRRLVRAYAPDEGRAIIVPTHDGRQGNPVLWDRRFFEAMSGIAGDTGARHLIGENRELVAEVEIGNPSVLLDMDVPEALPGAAEHRQDPVDADSPRHPVSGTLGLPEEESVP